MEIQTIQSAMAGVRRIDAFLAQPERAVPKRNETAARGDVALSHVTFGYGESPFCATFSMTVRQGEQVMLVGRTGAGKSTVFKLLLGLYQPEAGTVTIGGVDVSRISDQERRTCIGCVEQHFPACRARSWTRLRWETRRSQRRWRKTRRSWPVSTPPCRRFRRAMIRCAWRMFSQGRVAAAVHCPRCGGRPAVLLLDEITANLDAETEARVLEALRRASEGRTVLFPFRTASMKISAAEPSRSERRPRVYSSNSQRTRTADLFHAALHHFP